MKLTTSAKRSGIKVTVFSAFLFTVFYLLNAGIIFAQSVLPPEITHALFVGVRGDDVLSLQAYFAQDKLIYPEGLVTGYFGKLTEAAVKRFQVKYGIDAVGIVGPITRAKLKELRLAIQAQAPIPTPAPTPTEPTSTAPLPSNEPTTTPTPAPVNPADLIKTGTGIVGNNQYLKIGPVDFYYTGSYGYEGRGYLMPGTVAGEIANQTTRTNYSSCENISIRNYVGISNICQFTNPANYTFSTHTDAVRMYDKGTYYTVDKTCYEGILLFKQNGIYGAIDPEDVDLYDNTLHYKYWYDESGGTNFGSLCSSAGNNTSNLASALNSLAETLQKFKESAK